MDVFVKSSYYTAIIAIVKIICLFLKIELYIFPSNYGVVRDYEVLLLIVLSFKFSLPHPAEPNRGMRYDPLL